MPYIEQNNRAGLAAGYILPDNPGELNFVISTTIFNYMKRKGQNYQMHNEIIGVLECVKQEWYRRLISPYEDFKCEVNGDVYV